MSTLGAILPRVAECLKGLRYGTATGGSPTTLIDTAMDEPNDFFNGGTIFILSGANINKFASITDFNSTTFTFTFPTMTTAIVAGVQYAALHAAYNKDSLIAAVNIALQDMGPYTTAWEDSTDGVFHDDGRTFTLPTGWESWDVVRVEVQDEDEEEDDYWKICYDWRQDGRTIYFDNQYLENTKVRISYNTAHARVSAYSDTIATAYPVERIVWLAAYYAALNRIGFAENSEPHTKELLGLLDQRRREAMKYPVKRLNRDPRKFM